MLSPFLIKLNSLCYSNVCIYSIRKDCSEYLLNEELKEIFKILQNNETPRGGLHHFHKVFPFLLNKIYISKKHKF